VNLAGGMAALFIAVCLWWLFTTPSAAEMERKRERIYRFIADDYSRHSESVGRDFDRDRFLTHLRATSKDESYSSLLKHAKEFYGYKE
jgi:hypothetical protein